MPFDPELFVQQTIDQPLETERKLCPEGEYRFTIGDFEADAVESFDFTYKSGPKAGQPGSMVKFSCPLVTEDPKVVAAMGQDRVTVYKSITLDTETDGFTLSWGANRNIELGKLREAVKQNQAGKPWNLMMLRGAGPIVGKVEHRSGKRKDGTEFTIAEVTRVASIR